MYVRSSEGSTENLRPRNIFIEKSRPICRYHDLYHNYLHVNMRMCGATMNPCIWRWRCCGECWIWVATTSSTLKTTLEHPTHWVAQNYCICCCCYNCCSRWSDEVYYGGRAVGDFIALSVLRCHRIAVDQWHFQLPLGKGDLRHYVHGNHAFIAVLVEYADFYSFTSACVEVCASTYSCYGYCWLYKTTEQEKLIMKNSLKYSCVLDV